MGPKTKLLLLVMVAACCPRIFAQPAGTWRGPRVIIIGVDGLSVDGVATASVPRLRALMARAAWTMEARAVLPTLSSPNWASAINGASPAQHGITSNGYFRHMVEFAPVCRTEDGKFPTIFGLLRSAYPESRIAVFHDWDGFADLLEKQAPDVMRHVAGAANTTVAAIAYWTANRPALMFIHLDNVDHSGHAHGWLSKEYYKAVEDADAYVGQVQDMVDALAARESTYILITSDHGGNKHGHGKNSLAEIQIPWILAGPGVTPGEIAVPVNIFDTALTVAWIFHLDPSQCWIGRPVLTAFRPSLVAAHTNAARALLPDCAESGQLTGAVDSMKGQLATKD
jgi:predicted AlkP superfamily pyrophosphatase or phosphodiesterase